MGDHVERWDEELGREWPDDRVSYVEDGPSGSDEIDLRDKAPRQAAPRFEPPRYSPPSGEAPDRESPDTHPSARLRGLDTLPRRVRRRMSKHLAHGESVECVVTGTTQGGTGSVVATTHRLILDDPVEGVTELPYHRSAATISQDGTLEICAQEFGRTRCVTIRPRADHLAEVAHLLSRLDEQTATEACGRTSLPWT